MTLFEGRYRIESTRVPGWDYRDPAWYFVTICSKDRECSLSAIENDVVRLSSAGRVVDDEWLRTAHIRRNVRLDAYVIMPNHIHGIIVIEPSEPVETTRRAVSSPMNANEDPDGAEVSPR
jgi:putative transposase